MLMSNAELAVDRVAAIKASSNVRHLLCMLNYYSDIRIIYIYTMIVKAVNKK